MEPSVSRLVEGVQNGESFATREVWDLYYEQLVELARHRLRGVSARVVDEEDLVTHAFASFFRRAQQGKFPDLRHSDELRSLLVRITERKVVNHIRHHTRKKRGGGRVRGDSAVMARNGLVADEGFGKFAADGPSPEWTVTMLDLLEQLLLEEDDDMQQIVFMKLSGHSNQEIAGSIQRSMATVERRLRLIRGKWEQELG